MKKVLFALTVALSAASAQATTSITQYGIIWTWQEDRAIGQYASGDYWVIGPITLTGISPASIITTSTTTANVTANGTMLNPIPGSYPPQGFDSRIGGYVEALNIARQGGNPLSGTNTRTIPAGSSICSAISRLTAGAGEHSFLSDFAVLTVVGSAPAAGAFRPPYGGTVKTFNHNKSELDYSILKNLMPGIGMHAPTSSAFTRPWVQVGLQYNNARDFTATNNQIEYDRDIGYAMSWALLELHQNYTNAQKETAYVRLVQYGIDLYGALKYGVDSVNGQKYAPMSDNTGPKSLLVLAALALNDADMKYFADDANRITSPWISGAVSRGLQDYASAYVAAGHVGAKVKDENSIGRPRYTYTAQMLGLPEWGFENGTEIGGAGSNWGVIYRNVRYTGMAGIALAMQLTTGARALWNHEAWFDYMDRSFSTYTHSNSDPTPSYVVGWWNSFRSLGGPVWPQAAPVSGIGWIPANGTQLTIEYTDNVTAGAGGSGGLAVNASRGAVTATYASSPSSTQRTYTLSRTIDSIEVVTYTYTQPGNGLENPTSGADVASAAGVPVVNYSTVKTGIMDRQNTGFPVKINVIAGPVTAANPCFGHAVFRLSAAVAADSPDLKIYDQHGTLVHHVSSINTRIMVWDGRDSAGKPIRPGLYLYELSGSHGRYSGRLVLAE